MDALRNRFGARKFIVYFQAFTNTYAPVEILKKLYDEGLSHEDVVGLSVGTRPDCIDEKVLDLLESYAGDREVWLELGLQSMSNETLTRINRGHSVEDFFKAVDRVKLRKRIKICAHMILGFPWEERELQLSAAPALAEAGVHGLKLHLLHVVRGTKLCDEYMKGGLRLLEKEEYVNIVCDFLEQVPPEVVIQRLTGEAVSEILVAPAWCGRKRSVLNDIERELARRDSWQGKYV